MLERSEVLAVASSMTKFGGNFVCALGEALLNADPINQAKIKETWFDYWEQYKLMGEKKMESEKESIVVTEKEKKDFELDNKTGIGRILIEFPDKINAVKQKIYAWEVKKGEMLSINKTIVFDLKRSIAAEKMIIEVEKKVDKRAMTKEEKEDYKPEMEPKSVPKFTNDMQREAAVQTRLINHKDYLSNAAQLDKLDKDITYNREVVLDNLKRMHNSAIALAGWN